MILKALRYVPPGRLFQDNRIFVEDAVLLSFIFELFWLEAFPAHELRAEVRSRSPEQIPESMERLIEAGYLERVSEDQL